MRVAYLGPPGTFSEDALEVSRFAPADFSPMITETIPAAVEAVASGEADRALVPVENSIEGSVRPTLDALIEQAEGVRIVGEYDHEIRSALIAKPGLDAEGISAVISHPQPLAQCARFLRSELPQAELQVATSTSAAVRSVATTDLPHAALGPARAAALYGCVVIREGIEDEPGNVTRFLYLAPRSPEDEVVPADKVVGDRDGAWKTSLAFAELGADHPGALVEALQGFSSQGVNLVRIESRPMRRELGRYRFFIDIDGREDDDDVGRAIANLRTRAEWVRVLGSYPTG